jgi:hypothetical protein
MPPRHPITIAPRPGLQRLGSTLRVIKLTRINFDDVQSGTAIDSHYANLGTEFKSITTSPFDQWSTYAVTSVGAPHTGPNSVGLFPSGWPVFNARSGGIRARPLSSGAIWAKPFRSPEALGTDDSRPFLEAFDENESYFTVTRFPVGYSDPAFETWQRMSVVSGLTPEAAPKIGSVVFSTEAVGANNIWTEFDSLEFWTFSGA